MQTSAATILPASTRTRPIVKIFCLCSNNGDVKKEIEEETDMREVEDDKRKVNKADTTEVYEDDNSEAEE